MAKKKSITPTDIFNSLNKINPLSTMDASNSDLCKIDHYIDTGSWIVNAAISGSIKKGIANNKIYQFAGVSGAGKTYLCLNAIKYAQQIGYTVIYIDTESAVESSALENFGIDTRADSDTPFIYNPIGKVSELKYTLTKLVDDFKKAKISGGETPRTLVILDSIGMVASDKEFDDALDSKKAQDMSRAKGIRSLFRNVTLDLGLCGIPMIYTNHVGVNIGGYGDPIVISGGEGNKYSASVSLCLSVSKLREDKSDDKRQTGVLVKAKTLKNRFGQPLPIDFHIDFRKPLNRYIGIHKYINWEDVGITKGKILKPHEIKKLSKTDLTKVIEFTPDNSDDVVKFLPSDTARNYVIRHLGEAVPIKDLYTPRVMEPLVDEFDKVISADFAFGSEDIEENIDNLLGDIDNE